MKNERNNMKKKVIIIGGGPAGLTAAYELLRTPDEYEVVVFEEGSQVGGIAKTVNYKGNRMDMGGHRFFSKMPEVNEWWNEMLPVQGAPAYDDKVLFRDCSLEEGGPDPEKEDRVMLRRNRISRIFFNNRFFDYPISLKPETFTNMGLGTTLEAGFSYVGSMVHKRKEVSLEDFYINRFGKKLYSMFFEHYTENVWGRHPSQMTAEWGAQRVKGVSIMAVLKDAVGKAVHIKGKKNGEVETSLIEEFSYPKYGPGQLWEITADEILKKGGRIELNACVKKIHKAKGRVLTGVTWERDGQSFEETGDIFISSMPIKDLVGGMNNVPEKPAEIAAGLPYRDYMTVGVLVPRLKLQNKTRIPTIGNIVPDDWVYVHDRGVKMGRFQIFNNWSPYMVADIEHTVWIGLEYFCNEGDEMWSMADEDFAKLGVSEMVKIGMIDSPDEVIDSHVERVKKAYPAYFDTYDQIDRLRRYLDKIPNLYCVGRNGQHRYNNLDHSMMTSFEAVKNIREGIEDRSNIWNVNTEQSYHEKK